MPIELKKLQENTDAGFALKPDTHGFRIMRVLAQHPDLAFTAKELSDEADVPTASIYKTLSRPQERDLVQRIDNYWAIGDDDRIASHVASMYSRTALREQYGDDWYANNPGWDDDYEDLGENA